MTLVVAVAGTALAFCGASTGPAASRATAVATVSGPTGSRTASDPTTPASLTSLIKPRSLEAVQQSIVGVVTIWKEPVDPFSDLLGPPDDAPEGKGGDPEIPAVSFCTGWFESADTIVTAGHCVDPKEGRLALDLSGELQFDPQTGMPLPLPPVRPDPERTVFVFQPRELPRQVIAAPTEVRVHSFRSADDGDTAKLEVHGLPAGHPLPIAESEPLLGEAVTSIGFPGTNIGQTDGVELAALMSGTNPAQVLQDSRLMPVSSSGTLTARQFRHGSAVFQTNADVATGTSGGPTINARGEVLGVNSMMSISFTAQNFNIITDTGMLREFLDLDAVSGEVPDHDAAAEGATSSAGSPDGTPTASPTGPPSETPSMPTLTPSGAAASEATPAMPGLPVGWMIGLPALGAVAGAGAAWMASRVHLRRRIASAAGDAGGQSEPALKEATSEQAG